MCMHEGHERPPFFGRCVCMHSGEGREAGPWRLRVDPVGLDAPVNQTLSPKLWDDQSLLSMAFMVAGVTWALCFPAAHLFVDFLQVLNVRREGYWQQGHRSLCQHGLWLWLLLMLCVACTRKGLHGQLPAWAHSIAPYKAVVPVRTACWHLER